MVCTSTIVPYIWNKDESDDSCCCQSQPQCKQRCMDIHVLRQHNAYYNQHYHKHTCDVDNGCNIFTIVDTFHLHLACSKGQDDSSKLKKSFVANQGTQGDGTSYVRTTDVMKEVLGDF